MTRLRLLPIVFDIETSGLDPFKDRVLAIAYKMGSNKPRVMCIGNRNAASEKLLLDEFFSRLSLLKAEENVCPLLIGYNIDGFDIPFLTTRAILNGMVEESAMLRKFYRADLMHIVTRYLRTNNRHMKLKDVAEALGIDVVDEVNGSDIPRLFEEGNYEAIVKHCISDVELTYQLMLKLKPLVEHNVERRYKSGKVELLTSY